MKVLENQKLKKMKFYLLWRRTGDIVKAYADSFNVSEELASKTLYEMKEEQEKLIANMDQPKETFGARK